MPPSRRTLPLVDTPTHHDRWQIQITDDASRTLIERRGTTAYHSASGGLSETRHVYLEGSGVQDRLRSRKATRVLEVGLGTGLGLLLTLDAALARQTPLHYVAIENDWLPADVLAQLHLEEHLEHRFLTDEFLRWRDSLGLTVPRGLHRRRFDERTEVEIHHGDALQFYYSPEASFDAIYFDPFAPSVNPELWSDSFFAALRPLLARDGKLATYCVNRQVRETLQRAGFTPHKVPGPPGGKREVLIATRAK